MLPRANRLRKEKEFQRVYRAGKRTYSQHFCFTHAPNSLGHLRLAAVISKKISKSAVARNRLRRMIHLSVQDVAGKLPSGLESSLDVVVSPKQGADALTQEEVAAEVSKPIIQLLSGGR